jgi:hypothetical protein
MMKPRHKIFAILVFVFIARYDFWNMAQGHIPIDQYIPGLYMYLAFLCLLIVFLPLKKGASDG